MGLEQQIREKLEHAFDPTELLVRNESHKHAGHSGDDGSGESHWHIEMTSAALSGQSRIAKHRAVHGALGEDIISRIHALSMSID